MMNAKGRNVEEGPLLAIIEEKKKKQSRPLVTRPCTILLKSEQDEQRRNKGKEGEPVG